MRSHSFENYLVTVTVPYLLVAVAHAGGVPGRSFTFQGQLKTGGVPTNATCDFEFSLWDGDIDPDSGIQIESTIPLTTEVSNGLFQVELDFGPTAFNGDARWLGIDVCCPSPCAPGLSTLSPRQKLTPTPYALFALNGGGSGGDGHSLDAADGDPVDALFVDNDGKVVIQGDDPVGTGLVLSNSSSNRAWELVSGGSDPTFNGSFVISDGLKARLAISGTGNVGLGTTTPGVALHLNKALRQLAQRFETTRIDPSAPSLTDTRSPREVLALGGGVTWRRPEATLVLDGSFSTITLTHTAGAPGDPSEPLQWSGFRINVPDNAIVTGIQVDLTHDISCSCFGCDGQFGNCTVKADFQLFSTISRGGFPGPVFSEVRTSTVFADNGDSSGPIGSEFDTWGLALTPEVVNSSDFVVRMFLYMELFRTSSSFGIPFRSVCDCDAQVDIAIDAVTVTVYYRDQTIEIIPVDWTLGIEEGETSFRIAPTADLSDPVMTFLANGFVGIGVPNPVYRLELPNISILTRGKGRANAWVTYSSRRYKQNIEPIDHALQKVLGLTGVSFDWKPQQGGGHDIGFIAEDVAAVVPELVEWEADGKNTAGLKYSRITALSVEAIKEQQQQITDQQKQIKEQGQLTKEQQQQIHLLREKNVQLTDRLERLEAVIAKHFGTTKEE